MTHRYGMMIGVILLCVGMLTAQGITEHSAASSLQSAHNDYARLQGHRAHQKPVLRSASVWVEDQQTGECLVRKHAETVLPIASITKLMTAMVVLDAKLNLQESLTIAREDVDTRRHSRSRLPVGTRITRGDALLLALMSSENRAAIALGRTYPGSLTAFVRAMNAKATSIGLTETRFDEPSGISSGNVSSARDLARMVDAAYRYPLIRDFTTRKEASIHVGRHAREFRNSNRLIRSPRWQIGLSKTGYIGEAGRCLVMQAHVANRPLLIVLLDSQGKLTRYGDANRIRKWMEGPLAGQWKHRG